MEMLAHSTFPFEAVFGGVAVFSLVWLFWLVWWVVKCARNERLRWLLFPLALLAIAPVGLLGSIVYLLLAEL